MRDIGHPLRGCTQTGEDLLLGFPVHDTLLLSGTPEWRTESQCATVLLAYLSGTRRSKWRRWRTKTPMYPDIRLFCCFLYICLYGVPPAPLSDKIGANKGIREWRTARKLRHKCATVRHSPCSE